MIVRSSEWVGKAVGLDELVGSFTSQFSDNPPTKFDLTDLLQKYPSRTYYVAVQNLAPADMGVSQIFIEIIK